jgi:VWFA-related protein
MQTRLLASLIVLVLAAPSFVVGQQAPTFRSGVNLILVDVTVRDGKGQPIRNLTANDFEILENGKPQAIVSFAQEEVAQPAQTIVTAATLSRIGEAKSGVPVRVAPTAATDPKNAAATSTVATSAGATAAATPTGVDANRGPLTSEEVAGRRIWVLLFDTSSMQPEDVQKAADAAIKWGKERMSPADLVAVASIGSTLQILSDFTNDRDKIVSVLKGFAVTDGTATADVDASTMTADEATNTATTATATVDASVQELDSFNNDIRLRGIKTICDGLLSIQQRKSILYFSSGMARNGSDNAVESRAAVNACSRANTSINPVDSRGLQAIVAGGSARQGSRGGVAAFSGRGVANQFAQRAAQQETLQSLAADTAARPSRTPTTSAKPFDKITTEISSYYILGYGSSNTKQDGTYRKIEVRLKSKLDARVRAREGYYADRDFTHTSKGDRETQMQEQLLMAIPATDVPLFVTAGYFRLTNADACGQQVDFGGRPGGPGGGRGGGGTRRRTWRSRWPWRFHAVMFLRADLDGRARRGGTGVIERRGARHRGFVRDERNQPFATIKQTVTVPAATRDALASRQVLFQTGATLPPGRYIARIIVRENVTGKMGTFETTILVPELTRAPVKVSSIVMSTQLQQGRARAQDLSPLVHDNLEIIPNLTHVVTQDQKLYFYYEVYEPAMIEDRPQLRTNLTFYRGKVKVYETPIVERTSLDAVDRKAAIFEFEVDAKTFTPGLLHVPSECHRRHSQPVQLSRGSICTCAPGRYTSCCSANRSTRRICFAEDFPGKRGEPRQGHSGPWLPKESVMPLRIRPAPLLSWPLLSTAVGCAPLPYSLNFAKDNIVGIDVALESDVAFVDQPGAARTRVTLVRHFVRGSEVHEVSAAIGTVMASTNLANLKLRATGHARGKPERRHIHSLGPRAITGASAVRRDSRRSASDLQVEPDRREGVRRDTGGRAYERRQDRGSRGLCSCGVGCELPAVPPRRSVAGGCRETIDESDRGQSRRNLDLPAWRAEHGRSAALDVDGRAGRAVDKQGREGTRA